MKKCCLPEHIIYHVLRLTRLQSPYKLGTSWHWNAITSPARSLGSDIAIMAYWDLNTFSIGRIKT
jgi:hypothetical protein